MLGRRIVLTLLAALAIVMVARHGYAVVERRWQSSFYDRVADRAETRDSRPQWMDPCGAKRQKLGDNWADNKARTYDDQRAFHDRSLRTPNHAGACVPAGECNDQHFEYQWDEVGRLVRARRWDAPNWDTVPPAAELSYVYDASDARIRKTVGDRHTIYIFGSLELRLAAWTADGYEVSDATEVPYLFAHGVRLARVVHTGAPDFTTPSTRVYLELGDHLGSTSVVLARATGELVERSTAYAYGAPESQYRPGRWEEFREDYRFTGKEDDVEVGLIYFGARYYAPLLNRWISADPLAVHAPGKADLNLYAYVHGRVLVAVDAVGLEGADAGAPEPDAGPAITDAGTKPDMIPGGTQTGPTGGPIYETNAQANEAARVTTLEAVPRGAANAALDVPRVVTWPAALVGRAANIPALHAYDDVLSSIQSQIRAGVPQTPLGEASYNAGYVGTSVAIYGGLQMAADIRAARTAFQAVQTGERLELTAPSTIRGAGAARAGAVDPKSIRFTQDSIKGSFKSGGTLSETIEGLKSGKIDPDSFPAIRTFERDGQVFTLDNRRLHVFQQAGVPKRTVPTSAEEVASEAWKFTTKNGGESIRVRGQ